VDVPARLLDLRLVLLSGGAGCLDAVCFLGFDQIFTANQTGNTVLLGIAIGQGDWARAGRASLSVLAFCAGALVAALLLRELRHRRGYGPRLASVLGIAAALVGLLALTWALGPIALAPAVIFAAVAMGAQTVAAQHVGVPAVSTTFVTGTLVRLVTRAAGGDAPPVWETTPALVWVTYLGGAIAGGVMMKAWSVALPSLLVALVIAGVALSVVRLHGDGPAAR
jgi:uncharacterized membrane protein YoaK (UPF0700 family)